MSATDKNPLGNAVAQPDRYAPEILCPIAREEGRAGLGFGASLPFDGVDIWNAWELSWLDAHGKPVCAVAEIRVPATSMNLVESKSLKLYLNSLCDERYASRAGIEALIARDLSRAAGATVAVRLFELAAGAALSVRAAPGVSIDDAQAGATNHGVAPDLLSGAAGGEVVDETLHSNLFKSNCPVTGQPDWATVVVHYRGPRIERAPLLAYLLSFRRVAEFHEHCVERIFTDVQRHCGAAGLTVYARFTRRGGVDINPFRSSLGEAAQNLRLVRQ